MSFFPDKNKKIQEACPFELGKNDICISLIISVF